MNINEASVRTTKICNKSIGKECDIARVLFIEPVGNEVVNLTVV